MARTRPARCCTARQPSISPLALAVCPAAARLKARVGGSAREMDRGRRRWGCAGRLGVRTGSAGELQGGRGGREEETAASTALVGALLELLCRLAMAALVGLLPGCVLDKRPGVRVRWHQLLSIRLHVLCLLHGWGGVHIHTVPGVPFCAQRIHWHMGRIDDLHKPEDHS